MREEIELSSLAKLFLREQIKSECWNSMTVKGKVIKVSKPFQRGNHLCMYMYILFSVLFHACACITLVYGHRDSMDLWR